MSISERQKLVLNAIVNYYLTYGDTIGSRTLVKKYGIDLSSATIRNVMADLEDMGYIAKTHSSSGRIPTDKGYKYYLEELLKIEKLTTQEKHNIELVYESRINELDSLLQQTSSLLSKMTTYAGIAMEPTGVINKIKKVELIYVDEFMVILVAIFQDRSVTTKKIFLNSKVTKEEIDALGEELTVIVENNSVTLEEIQEYIISKKRLIPKASKEYEEEGKLFIENVPSIFKDRHVNEIFEALELFHHRDDMKNIFQEIINTRNSTNGEVNVILGDELGIKGLEDLSFVYSTYNIGEGIGVIGVIGPKRMAYSKTMGLIEYVTEEVNKVINKNKNRK